MMRSVYPQVMLSAIMLLAVLAAGVAQAAEPPASFERCRNMLTTQLRVEPATIEFVKASPASFLDGSLGFPRPGETYTKAITRGHLLTLQYKGREYLVAANDTVCRYGGPVQARSFSALYIEPIENEPNMNGTLVQIALAGDNPRVMLAGVSDFRPQPDGSIIAKRRTSRSTHDLLYLARGKTEQAVTLATAMDFTDAAVTNDGKRWMAIVRPRLGAAGWQLIGGPVPQQAEGEGVALPAGVPQRVYLHMTHPVVRVAVGDGVQHFELADGNWRPVRFEAPPTEEMLMSRSTSLAVETKEVEGKPVTEVLTLWWHGQRDPIVKLPDFTAREASLTPESPFLLLSGTSGETTRAYTVDIVTGAVLVTVAQSQGPVRLLLAPSMSPIVMSRPTG